MRTREKEKINVYKSNNNHNNNGEGYSTTRHPRELNKPFCLRTYMSSDGWMCVCVALRLAIHKWKSMYMLKCLRLSCSMLGHTCIGLWINSNVCMCVFFANERIPKILVLLLLLLHCELCVRARYSANEKAIDWERNSESDEVSLARKREKHSHQWMRFVYVLLRCTNHPQSQYTQYQEYLPCIYR